MSDVDYGWICSHRNVLCAQSFTENTCSIFKYDEAGAHETKLDAPQHTCTTVIDTEFKGGFCVIQDFIVMIRTDQPQLYFFSLEGDFVKTESMPILKDKYILKSYNQDSILVQDDKHKELWVVKLNGEATKIKIDLEDPREACVSGKNLFLYCGKTQCVIKYVLS